MDNTRLKQLKEFLAAEPDDPFLKYALAQEYLGTGEREKAAEMFLRLMEEHPAYVPTYYHYGKMVLEEGNEEDAGNIWRRGIEKAREAGDRHAENELREILSDLEDW